MKQRSAQVPTKTLLFPRKSADHSWGRPEDLRRVRAVLADPDDANDCCFEWQKTSTPAVTNYLATEENQQ
ncbi:hypothetical protein E4U55_005338 [Claviceps digitariae]|nr:hypothetical protein E4U55_005338 [Claviceps digitariae]